MAASFTDVIMPDFVMKVSEVDMIAIIAMVAMVTNVNIDVLITLFTLLPKLKMFTCFPSLPWSPGLPLISVSTLTYHSPWGVKKLSYVSKFRLGIANRFYRNCFRFSKSLTNNSQLFIENDLLLHSTKHRLE